MISAPPVEPCRHSSDVIFVCRRVCTDLTARKSDTETSGNCNRSDIKFQFTHENLRLPKVNLRKPLNYIRDIGESGQGDFVSFCILQQFFGML